MNFTDKYLTERMVGVPEHLRDGLALYIMHGYQPGGFLTAVLENDLFQAVNRGDDDSQAGLVGLVGYLYNEAPARCHGSPDRVTAWMQQGGLDGLT